jgi:hypothetical protein
MPAQANGDTITFLEWTADKGLIETRELFTTLNDLFSHCLSSGTRGHIEEVFINGYDEVGRPRQVTLTFRSALQPLGTTT